MVTLATNRVKPVGLALLALSLVFIGCGGGDDDDKSSASNGGNLSSSSIVYDTIQIGTQVWMKKNLNVKVTGSKCYGDDAENCGKYGSLYNWAMAMDFPDSCNTIECGGRISTKHQGICPQGWHIPNIADWDALASYAEATEGCSNCAARFLKAASDWGTGNGEDSYGFAALPGGSGGSNGGFNDVGSKGYFWSAMENEAVVTSAIARSFIASENIIGDVVGGKADFYSVRCLKN